MEKELIFKFEFTLDEANAILAGLQELPAKISNPLSAKIQQQAQSQIAKAEEQKQAEIEALK